MRSLTFKSLRLLSEQEKKARTVMFDPKRNLILGKNLQESIPHTTRVTVVEGDVIAASPMSAVGTDRLPMFSVFC